MCGRLEDRLRNIDQQLNNTTRSMELLVLLKVWHTVLDLGAAAGARRTNQSQSDSES